MAVLCLVLGAREAAAQWKQRFGVATPMRDGIDLVSDIYVPADTGRWPTILIRTPYVKTPQFKRYKLASYLQGGYAVVLQDTRGRGDSEGEFNFYFPEGKDGFDIEWIAKQAGPTGASALTADHTWGRCTAAGTAPALACMISTAPSGRIFDEIPFLGGAWRGEWAVPWLQMVSGRVSQADLAELIRWGDVFKHRPLATMDAAAGRELPLYREFLAHPTLDDYWKRIQFGPRDFEKIRIPVMTVTGWFDGDQLGALFYWDGMEQRGGQDDTRWLTIGPWTHAMTYLGGERKVGQFEVPQESIVPIQENRIAFFDWCLKRSKPKVDLPRVRVFVTGANRWIHAERYPLPEVETRSLYLRSGGAANTSSGDGRLSWDAPREEPADTFTYDPRNPVPSRAIMSDHRVLQTRPDVLVYTSEALTAPVEIVGRVFVTLVAASDARDTDFTAKLLDVYPDGRAVLLGPSEVGVKRARYRKGYDRTELLTPGKAEEYRIELFDVGHRFLSGHRIRVEISSSASPFITPNSNTGLPIATDTTFAVARQTIYHDAARPSRVLLPVLPIRDSVATGTKP
jgi:putative CocE/NonD family hydrolase